MGVGTVVAVAIGAEAVAPLLDCTVLDREPKTFPPVNRNTCVIVHKRMPPIKNRSLLKTVDSMQTS